MQKMDFLSQIKGQADKLNKIANSLFNATIIKLFLKNQQEGSLLVVKYTENRQFISS